MLAPKIFCVCSRCLRRVAIIHPRCSAVSGASLKILNGTQPLARAVASRQTGAPETGSEITSRAAINRDVESAHAAGAHHTPSFFVNGRPVTDRTLGGLEVAVRAALAER